MTQPSALFKFPEYEQHPLAIELMPGGMDESEFTAFCEDVEERGVIVPITLFEGKVLDGWHRYRAARKIECSFKEIEYKGKDPAGYIASVNVLRRKLGSLQRAMVGCRLHLNHKMTQREVCKKLGVSNEVVNLVLRALQSKNAKLVKRIETDTDYTRGMLREELEDMGLLRNKAVEAAPKGPTSVFDLAGKPFTPEGDTDGIPYEDDDTGPIGNDKPLSKVGKKPAHTERRAKETAAHRLAEGFKALMADEKVSFLRMIHPEARLLMLEEGLLVVPAKTTAQYKEEADRAEATPEELLATTSARPLKPTGKPINADAVAAVAGKALKGVKGKKVGAK